MRGARGISCARSSGRVECSDKASAGFTTPSGRRSNTRGSPTVENTRFLWPMPPAVPSSSIASSTFSRLWAGSPMPMNTTFFTTRRVRASATCATISALPTWRSKPSRPVMQNTQPTAQPTCVDTHKPSRGSSTLSTVCPSARSTSKRAEPSSPGCSERSRARPCTSSINAGKASRTLSGRKSSGLRRPLSCGKACAHKRSTRCSWTGLAPAARSRGRISSMRMPHCPPSANGLSAVSAAGPVRSVPPSAAGRARSAASCAGAAAPG